MISQQGEALLDLWTVINDMIISVVLDNRCHLISRVTVHARSLSGSILLLAIYAGFVLEKLGVWPSFYSLSFHVNLMPYRRIRKDMAPKT